jgi:hypothetical protein
MLKPSLIAAILKVMRITSNKVLLQKRIAVGKKIKSAKGLSLFKAQIAATI